MAKGKPSGIGSKPVIRQPVTTSKPIRTPSRPENPASTKIEGSRGAEQLADRDLTGRQATRDAAATAGQGGSGEGNPSPTSNSRGDRSDSGDNRPHTSNDLNQDLANSAGDPTRVQVSSSEIPAAKRVDAPAPLTEKEITRQVGSILDQDRFLNRYPHTRRWIEDRIRALPLEHQIGVANTIPSLTRNRRVRQMFKDLDNEHALSLFKQMGFGGRDRPTPADRTRNAINELDAFLDREVVKLDANAREIKSFQERIARATSPEEARAIELSADPYLRQAAAEPPAPKDERDADLRRHDERAANERFETIVKELSNKRLAQRERRWLWTLLGFEFLLAGIHASVPPER